ncbi:hypothetical protein IW262DRAFT_1302551 [Armillaria fumosa]|nr:hypothetical protein IW262DRAFT_1302551 [Armillaria fumosa]
MPLLAWTLTGDSHKAQVSASLVTSTLLKGYCALLSARLHLWPQNKSYRRWLDEFEGEAYTVTPVQVAVVGKEDQMVEADIYLWNSERDALSFDSWNLDALIKVRLDDWIDLFGGMELVVSLTWFRVTKLSNIAVTTTLTP